jgi:hypothetical protein
MFAKNILIALFSLGALATAIPVNAASNEVAAPTDPLLALASADAAAPPPPPPNRPRPGQGQSGPPGRPREPPRPRPEGPRPGNGGRPGYDNGPRPGWNNGPRPGYDNGLGWPVVIPVPVLGGLGYDGPPGGLERYCESLNVNTYQLPGYVLDQIYEDHANDS